MTDVRPEPEGVYSAYFDITWDSSVAIATGQLTHGASYSNGKRGTVSDGLIDEAGGFAELSRLWGETLELFSVPMRAIADGSLLFETNPNDGPDLEMLVYGLSQDGEVRDDEVDYGTVFIAVGDGDRSSTFVAAADWFTVEEDSREAVLAPLTNDVSAAGHSNHLTIVAAGMPNRGGSVQIVAGGSRLHYTPAGDFSGREMFTYTVRNQYGEEHTAVVQVQVQDVNDPPTARSDTFRVDANSEGNSLAVLANDSTLPDPSDSLSVVSAEQTGRGGHVTPLGKSINFIPPPNFVGSLAFTYTIQDSGGLQSTATVTVEVVGTIEPPRIEAVDDVATVQDYTTPTVIDVLANDITSTQPNVQLRIVSVTPPRPDIPITVAQDGRSLIYTGSTVTLGSANISYVVSDALGTLSSAMLRLNFASAPLLIPGVTLEGGVLEITGSPGNDQLVVSQHRGRLRVSGALAGESVNESFALRSVRKIVAHLGEGDDSLTVRPNVGAALRVDAGAGHDEIFAGLGAAVLIGGDGDDRLRGGAKRDVLIGGTGDDRISAGSANDLVIQGATAYDGDFTALDAIAAEWGSRRSASVRRSNIQEGRGPILGSLDVSLDAGLLENGAAAVFHPLASRGRH